MNYHRIYGVVIRHLLSVRHNLDRISDVFYWPAIDVIVWGLTGKYVSTSVFHGVNVVVVIVSGLVFWTIVWRMPYEVAITLLDDLWSKNLINMFVSPLTFTEWLTATIIVSGAKGITSFLWTAFLAFLLYQVGIFSYGLYVIPFMLSLMFTGWTIGFFITALIFRFGLKVQSFGWTHGAIILPFSAVFYPLSILPAWVQTISHFVPSSYIFEEIRHLAINHTLDTHALYISVGLNIIYIIIATFLLRASFKGVLKKGLASSFT